MPTKRKYPAIILLLEAASDILEGVTKNSTPKRTRDDAGGGGHCEMMVACPVAIGAVEYTRDSNQGGVDGGDHRANANRSDNWYNCDDDDKENTVIGHNQVSKRQGQGMSAEFTARNQSHATCEGWTRTTRLSNSGADSHVAIDDHGALGFGNAYTAHEELITEVMMGGVINETKKAREVCSHGRCTTYAQRRGVCWKHGAKALMRQMPRQICIHEGCINQARRRGGLCRKHWASTYDDDSAQKH